jgi:hypothetical protein
MLPEHDEAAWQLRLVELREARAAIGRVQGFRPVSLADWMQLCVWAEVPTVAAICLGEAEIEPLLRSDEPEWAARATPFYGAMAAKLKALGDGWMARWDCCSMAEVKYRLSNGNASWAPELAELYSDDLRAYDLIDAFPSDRIKGWARPWTQFDVIGGWPVEYRVFVENDRILGVSNYYPQRPLPDNEQTAADVARAKASTQALIDHQNQRIVCPEIGDVEGNWFTCDFARLPSGALLFLEGGPPYTPTWGAHPCCFTSGTIEGVTLRDQTGQYEVQP